jgi:hypothetical protein
LADLLADLLKGLKSFEHGVAECGSCGFAPAPMSRYDRPSHKVYRFFFEPGGWQMQFLEADLKPPLPRKLTFADPERIRELVSARELDTDPKYLEKLAEEIRKELG